MSLVVLVALLVLVLAYWLVTQILPERERNTLLRPTLGSALIDTVNEQRHKKGLPMLELDDGLCAVAENKAVHQIMTGISEEGWDYPVDYSDLFGRSLLMESMVMGSLETIPDRLRRQRDLFDGEWVSCGVGVAGGKSEQVVVALILCREAWEPAMEAVRQPSMLERLVLGK